jgi:hypothetical protein
MLPQGVFVLICQGLPCLFRGAFPSTGFCPCGYGLHRR